MNIENFKTVILVNLVAISIFLTYSLWTYQPNPTMLTNSKYIRETPSVTQKDLSTLIVPSKLIGHVKDKHYTSSEIVNVSPLYEMLEKGDFDDLRNISSEIPKDKFLSFVHGSGKMEFVFPTNVSLNMMKNVFSIQGKNLEMYSFNRIVLDLDESHQSTIKTYFISYEERNVYEMTWEGKSTFIQELKERYDNVIKEKATACFAYQVDESRMLFLPEESVSIQNTITFTEGLSEEEFKNVLFTDPRYVKKDETDLEDIYTDGTRLFKVMKTKKTMEYSNLVPGESSDTAEASLVEKSVSFINSHGGWNDIYRLYHVNMEKNQTVFRQHVNSLPVFNREGMSTITQEWSTNKTHSYKRPFFKLDSWGLEPYVQIKTLESGRELVSLLEQYLGVNKQSIQDIGVGYEIKLPPGMTPSERVEITFEPIWYVLYDGSYKKIDKELIMEGGGLIGLE